MWPFLNLARRQPVHLHLRPYHVHEPADAGKKTGTRKPVATPTYGYHSHSKHKLVYLGQRFVLSQLGNLLANFRRLPDRSKPWHHQCSQIHDFHRLHYFLQMLPRLVSSVHWYSLPMLPLPSTNLTLVGRRCSWLTKATCSHEVWAWSRKWICYWVLRVSGRVWSARTSHHTALQQ